MGGAAAQRACRPLFLDSKAGRAAMEFLEISKEVGFVTIRAFRRESS
jgi:hypothetical protein